MQTRRDPEEAPEDPKSDDANPAEPAELSPRLPKPDPELDEKRFIVADDPNGGANLHVTVSGGLIEKGYGPAELLGRFVERTATAISAMSGSPTMLFGATPGNSMTLLFGDPAPSGEQSQIPLKQTLSAAHQIAELIELEGDALFQRAIELGGRRVRPYDELARLVASDGLTLDWHPLDIQPVRLSPDQADRQRKRFAEPPEMREWSLTVNGLLYGVLTEAPAKEGSIRIRPFSWSTLPPRASKKAMLRVHYEGPDLSAKIKDGLIGESVEAIVRVRQPRPGHAIDSDHMELSLADIYKGPTESSAFGTPVDEVLEDINEETKGQSESGN